MKYKSAREAMAAAEELRATLNDKTVPLLFHKAREFVSQRVKVEYTYTAGMASDAVFPEIWLRPCGRELFIVVNERFSMVNRLENGNAVEGSSVQRKSHITDADYLAAVLEEIKQAL